MTIQAFVDAVVERVAQGGTYDIAVWGMDSELAARPWPDGVHERLSSVFDPERYWKVSDPLGPDGWVSRSEVRRLCRDFGLCVPPLAALPGREQLDLM